MDLSVIDKAVEKGPRAVANDSSVEDQRRRCVFAFLHDYQVRSIRTSTSTGQWRYSEVRNEWRRRVENPIFTGALGMYNGVILHRWNRIQTPAANVYRGVLCSAQAVALAYGSENDQSRFTGREIRLREPVGRLRWLHLRHEEDRVQ